MKEAGKGDTMRPTDHKAFSENYDKIWPFPPKLIPLDHKPPKFNPENHEDAPL